MQSGAVDRFEVHEARRYGRQMLVPEVAARGQKNLLNSNVLVVGAGGIGSSAALYLASAGVPITILDHDIVEESNLHRQIIHDTDRVQSFKAESAVARLQAINPTLNYRAITTKLTSDNAIDIIQQFELVLDCTDNFDARFVINDACVLLKTPYISGSAVGLEGQITVVIPGETACYRCLYPNPSVAEACRSCANSGVLGPVPGLIGCLEATEAIKLLLISGSRSSGSSQSACNLQVLAGRQVFYDAANGEFFTFNLPPRNSDCSVCGDHPSITSLKDTKTQLATFTAETECAVRNYRGEIPAEHQLSISEFYGRLQNQFNADFSMEKAPVMVIVDVRSTVQFEIANLSQSSLVSRMYPNLHSLLTATTECSTDTTAKKSLENVVLVNIPLSELQLEENERKFIQFVVESAKPAHLLMLCRRGIDSSVATRRILQTLSSSGSEFKDLNVWNVQGGLTSWHSDIDPNFPMY